MSFHWINPKNYTCNIFLLMDRWLIRYIFTNFDVKTDYSKNLSIILASNPTLAWFCMKKAPETKNDIESLILSVPKNLTEFQIREAEEYILDSLDWAIVYVDPEVMNKNCNYIYNWDKNRLLELAYFKDKLVLDVGSGTGRLAFAVAPLANVINILLFKLTLFEQAGQTPLVQF